MSRITKIARTVLVSSDVWAKFKLMADEAGLSMNYCIDRVIRDAVNRGSIPGINALESHEARENAKYGPSTPIYDGNKEPQPKDAQSGRKHPSELT